MFQSALAAISSLAQKKPQKIAKNRAKNVAKLAKKAMIMHLRDNPPQFHFLVISPVGFAPFLALNFGQFGAKK